MFWPLLKILISAVLISTASTVAAHTPRWGGLLLTLPVMSLIAFVFTWSEQRDLRVVSQFAKETLILVPLGLPFFIPLALAERLPLGFWQANVLGCVPALGTISVWMRFGPNQL